MTTLVSSAAVKAAIIAGAHISVTKKGNEGYSLTIPVKEDGHIWEYKPTLFDGHQSAIEYILDQFKLDGFWIRQKSRSPKGQHVIYTYGNR